MTPSRIGFLALAVVLGAAMAALPVLAEEDEKKEEQPLETADAPTAVSLTQTIEESGGAISVQTMCTNCNSADLTLGSFGNEFISVTCDGLPVSSGLPQIYLLSVVPSWTIENVAVEQGAGRARLEGGAIGGEIEVSRREAEEGLQVQVTEDVGQYGWNGARAEVAGRAGWFGGTLNGTWAESDFVDADGDGNPDMASIDRSTYEARLDLRPGERHRIAIGVTGYDESQADGRAAYDLYASMALGRDVWEREQVEIDRKQYDLTYRWDLRDGSHLTAGLLHADRTTLISEEQGATSGIYQPTYDIGEVERHARIEWFRPLGSRAVLRVGGSRTEQDFTVVDTPFNLLQLLPEGFALEESPAESGAWAEGEISLGRGATLFAGVRYVDFDYTDNMEEVIAVSFVSPDWLGYDLPQGSDWLPRLALRWKPTDSFGLRFTAGRGYRQPPPTHDSVCCGRRYRGNRGILMERSRVLGLEADFQPAPGLKLTASAFRTDFDDMIVNMATWVENYVPIYQNVNYPSVLLENLSLGARWDVTSWASLRGDFSWTSALHTTPGEMVPIIADYYGMPYSYEIALSEVPFVPRRAGSAGLLLSPPGLGLSLDLSVRYAGLQTIQKYGEYYGMPGWGTPEFVSTPSYRVLNFRLSKSFPLGIDAFVGVDNILNYVQEDLADPSTDYTWGPLRGTYVYGGATFRFATGRT